MLNGVYEPQGAERQQVLRITETGLRAVLSGNLVPDEQHAYLLHAWKVLDLQQRRTRKTILRRQKGYADLSADWRRTSKEPTPTIQLPTSTLMRNGMRGRGEASLCGIQSPLNTRRRADTTLKRLKESRNGSATSYSSAEVKVKPATQHKGNKRSGKINKKPTSVTRQTIMTKTAATTVSIPTVTTKPVTVTAAEAGRSVRRIISREFTTPGASAIVLTPPHKKVFTPPTPGLLSPNLPMTTESYLNTSFALWMSQLDASFFNQASEFDLTTMKKSSPASLDIDGLLRRFSLTREEQPAEFSPVECATGGQSSVDFREDPQYIQIVEATQHKNDEVQLLNYQAAETGQLEPEPEKNPEHQKGNFTPPFRRTPGAPVPSSAATTEYVDLTPDEIFISDESLTSPNPSPLDFSLATFLRQHITPTASVDQNLGSKLTPLGRPHLSFYNKRRMKVVKVEGSTGTSATDLGEIKVSPPRTDVVGLKRVISGDDVWYFFTEDQTPPPNK